MTAGIMWGIRVTLAAAAALVTCNHERLEELRGAALRVGSVPIWPDYRRSA